jgi:HK97 family phage major capsid protein
MATSISKLQDRAAAVAAMLDDLQKVEERSEAQVAEIEKLQSEAGELAEKLDREHAIADKIATLRSKVAATAKPVEVADMPMAVAARKPASYTRLRGFTNSSDAEAVGRWIRGFLLPNHRAAAEDRAWYTKNVEERALASADNSKGGVFVPEVFASTLIRLVDEYSAIPQQANVMPMSSSTLYVPRRTGGNTAYFVSENSETTTSDMATDNVMLSAKDLRVGSRVPNSLIDDSLVDLAGLVAQEFALAISQKIDDAGFKGDGTSTHGGIRGIQWLFEQSPATAANKFNSAASSAGALTVDDFHAAMALAPSYVLPRAKWYVTPQLYHSAMRALALSSGGVTAAELAGGVGGERFMGYPVLYNNSMNTAAATDKVVALFGDLSLSTHYGLRREVAVRASTDRYIEFDQTYFQAVCRFDVVTSDIGDANKAGPVVALIL